MCAGWMLAHLYLSAPEHVSIRVGVEGLMPSSLLATTMTIGAPFSKGVHL